MPAHEKKQCPRCSVDFECKTGSILLCQCSKIEMSAEQLEAEVIRTQSRELLAKRHGSTAIEEYMTLEVGFLLELLVSSLKRSRIL